MASEIPKNFSWVEENVLAGSAFPDKISNVQYLVDNNIYSLVSLTAEKEVVRDGITDEFEVIRIPIRDYTPPTMAQVEQFLQIVQKTKGRGKATCIHCAHGLGRTGTMLSCYFVQSQGLTDTQAIEYVRKLRPGSVETAEQEALVAEFYAYWQDKKSKGEDKL